MHANGASRRAELYLRGDTYGTYEAQQRMLRRVRRLERDGALESMAIEDGLERIQTLDEDRRTGALATYREFADWARRNGVSLDPAFERRTRRYLGLDRVDEVVVFPVVTLALYASDRLEGVFPCTDGDRAYGVDECLDALERGDADWLTRFDGVTVCRTDPWLTTEAEG